MTPSKAMVALAGLLVVAAGGYFAWDQPPIELPPDGLELYATLRDEIPEVVSQVPCVCCNKTLSWCYAGGCPPT